MASHIAITPLVIARDSEGRHVYLYDGQPVPANVPAAEVKRLVDGGFLAAAEDTDEQPFPEGDPAESWKVDQLKAFAAADGIDLGDAKNKADILAAIAAAKSA